jgi:hypothetical protein
MSPPRERRKPVFDPNALDDLDEMWPAPKTEQPAPRSAQIAAQTPTRISAAVDTRAAATPEPAATQTATVTESHAHPAPAPPRPAPAPRAVASEQATRQRATTTTVPVPARETGKRTRPPEVLLSAEVYDELYRRQNAEKKARKALARTMGTIAMDAIEAHADRLATTWTTQEYAVGEGQLFERPASNAVPRRRRHATAPRTVVLSGVTAANGQRLDNLVQAWNAGTRSALVEQALRYEFNLLG